MAVPQHRVSRNEAAIQLLTKHIHLGRRMIHELREERAVLNARVMETRNLQADKRACTARIRELQGMQRDLHAIRRFRRYEHLQLNDAHVMQAQAARAQAVRAQAARARSAQQLQEPPARRIRLKLRVRQPPTATASQSASSHNADVIAGNTTNSKASDNQYGTASSREKRSESTSVKQEGNNEVHIKRERVADAPVKYETEEKTDGVDQELGFDGAFIKKEND